MPAGKLEENETLIDAAIRETKEETNLDVQISGLIAIQESITEMGQLIIFYFKGEYIAGEVSFNQEEISDVKWMTEEGSRKLLVSGRKAAKICIRWESQLFRI